MYTLYSSGIKGQDSFSQLARTEKVSDYSTFLSNSFYEVSAPEKQFIEFCL